MTAMADVETYKARVASLVAEKRALEQQLATERREAAHKVAVARAELREGINPELLALRREVTRWRDRALAAEARRRYGGSK